MSVGSLIDPAPAPWRRLYGATGPVESLLYTQSTPITTAADALPHSIIGPAAFGRPVIAPGLLGAGSTMRFNFGGSLTLGDPADTLRVVVSLGGTVIADNTGQALGFTTISSRAFQCFGLFTVNARVPTAATVTCSALTLAVTDAGAPSGIQFSTLCPVFPVSVPVSAAPLAFDITFTFTSAGPPNTATVRMGALTLLAV